MLVYVSSTPSSDPHCRVTSDPAAGCAEAAQGAHFGHRRPVPTQSGGAAGHHSHRLQARPGERVLALW